MVVLLFSAIRYDDSFLYEFLFLRHCFYSLMLFTILLFLQQEKEFVVIVVIWILKLLQEFWLYFGRNWHFVVIFKWFLIEMFFYCMMLQKKQSLFVHIADKIYKVSGNYKILLQNSDLRLYLGLNPCSNFHFPITTITTKHLFRLLFCLFSGLF